MVKITKEAALHYHEMGKPGKIEIVPYNNRVVKSVSCYYSQANLRFLFYRARLAMHNFTICFHFVKGYAKGERKVALCGVGAGSSRLF